MHLCQKVTNIWKYMLDFVRFCLFSFSFVRFRSDSVGFIEKGYPNMASTKLGTPLSHIPMIVCRQASMGSAKFKKMKRM